MQQAYNSVCALFHRMQPLIIDIFYISSAAKTHYIEQKI